MTAASGSPFESQAEAWYRGRVVVVTGGYGYLGSGLCSRLRAAGATLRRATRGRPDFGNDPDHESFVGDLTDEAFARRLVEGADVVFHFSGQTSIKASEEAPLADLSANVVSTLTLLAACARTEMRPAFVYSGTATEVGLTTETPIAASRRDQPITVYDANKLAAEQLVGVYSDRGSVRGVTLRIANVFGPGAAKSASDRGITNRLIARAMAGEGLVYFGDGAFVRDYVYVTDLLEAFFRAPSVTAPSPRRSYVVAGGKGYAFREVLLAIAEEVASMGYPKVNVSSAPWPGGTHPIDQRSFVADIAPLTSWMGWRPTTALREGIRLTAATFAGQTGLAHAGRVEENA